MNIVHVEEFFHPNAGYQINLLAKYMVKQGHTVSIITANLDLFPDYLTSFFGKNDIEKYDQLYSNETGVNIFRLPLKKYYSGRAIFGKELNEVIISLSPDILYVHGNDTYTGIKYILKRGKLPFALVSDSHMLEMASVNPLRKLFRMFYKVVVTPKIVKYKIPIIRTADDLYVQKCLGIPIEQCPFISFGSDTILFKPSYSAKKKFRKEYNISDNAFVVIYAGKLDASKGGKLLATAFQKRFLGSKEVILIVVSSTSGEYGKEVDILLEESENRIIRFPTQQYRALPRFYQIADLSVFPKQCSLSFYDAQACGLPVVSEDNNINVDRCNYKNGFNFITGYVEDFRAKIQKCLDMPEHEYQIMKENAFQYIITNYDYEKKAQEYTNILETELQEFTSKK